jgi:hypothetical protein
MRTQNTAKNADGTSTLLKDNEPCAVRNPLVGWRLYVLEARSSSVSVVPEREQDSFDVCLVPSCSIYIILLERVSSDRTTRLLTYPSRIRRAPSGMSTFGMPPRNSCSPFRDACSRVCPFRTM